MYKNPGRMQQTVDIVAIIVGMAQIIAIVIGGLWALSTYKEDKKESKEWIEESRGHQKYWADKIDSLADPIEVLIVKKKK